MKLRALEKILLLICIIGIYSCSKDSLKFNLEEKIFLEIKTGEIQEVGINKIRIQGLLNNTPNSEVLQVGHCWSNINNQPKINIDDFSNVTLTDSSFWSEIDGFSFSSLYFLRAYVITNEDTIYGNTKIYDISSLNIVTEGSSVQLNGRTAIVRGRIFSENNSILNLVDYGHCWSEYNSLPTTSDKHYSLGAYENNDNLIEFESFLDSLTQNFYYVRSYAIIGNSIVYGNVITLKVENIWERKATFGGKSRIFATGFSIGKYGYVGTGMNGVALFNSSEQEFYNDFWRYNSSDDFWEYIGEFPGKPRGGAISFVIDNKAYVGLGFDENRKGLNDLWMFDPENVSTPWTPLDSFPGGGRSASAITIIEDIVYLVGGEGSDTTYNDFWVYYPNKKKWEQRISIDTKPFRNAISFTLGKNLFVGLGDDDDSGVTLNYSVNKNLWVYDTQNMIWSMLNWPNEFQPRAFARTFKINEKVFVLGGVIKNLDGLSEIWKTESASDSDSWITLENNSAIKRAFGVTFVIEDKGYYGLGVAREGNTFPVLNDFWQFQP